MTDHQHTTLTLQAIQDTIEALDAKNIVRNIVDMVIEGKVKDLEDQCRRGIAVTINTLTLAQIIMEEIRKLVPEDVIILDELLEASWVNLLSDTHIQTVVDPKLYEIVQRASK